MKTILRLMRKKKQRNPKAPLFGSIAHRNSGERMTTRSISRTAKERLIAVGLDSDRLTAHSLRHTAATLNLLNGGKAPEEMMQQVQQLYAVVAQDPLAAQYFAAEMAYTQVVAEIYGILGEAVRFEK